MAAHLNRREFLGASASLAAGLALDGRVRAQAPAGAQPPAAPPVFKTKPHKALIQDKPTPEYLQQLKAAGFEGIETHPLPPAEAEKIRATVDGLGLRVHSVMRGWAAFNSADQSQVDQTFKETEDALRSAQAFGADTVLLVPCRVDAHTPGGFGQKNGILMPSPWEFQLEWDQKTGHLTRAVAGDNARYADYIRAQNHAVDTSTEMVTRLIPLAERTGVVIALENVWNNLWVAPAYFRDFVASFQSKWVRAYFDIGNHVKFEPPERWILALGSLIVKMHVKDYRLDPADADGQGSFVNIRDGSVRWPIVRAAIEQIGYTGWMTIEAPMNISIDEQGKRLGLILEGR